MTIFEIILLSFGLAMDCFAVCFSIGICQPHFKFKNQLILACLFGIFQGGMPVIGYYTGNLFSDIIQDFDHWIAGGLLFAIGGKMIYDSIFEKPEDNSCKNYMKLTTILILSIATSIDALAVGLSFSFLNTNIWFPVICICLITILVSLTAFQLSKYCAKLIKPAWAEFLGGIILIGIAVKIIIEHLYY